MKGKCATQRLALATFLARWGANRRASSVRLNQAESLHPTLRTYTFLDSLTKMQKLVSSYSRSRDVRVFLQQGPFFPISVHGIAAPHRGAAKPRHLAPLLLRRMKGCCLGIYSAAVGNASDDGQVEISLRSP